MIIADAAWSPFCWHNLADSMRLDASCVLSKDTASGSITARTGRCALGFSTSSHADFEFQNTMVLSRSDRITLRDADAQTQKYSLTAAPIRVPDHQVRDCISFEI